jgi:hypothetical protein
MSFKESLIKLNGQTTEPCSSNGIGKISPIAFLTSSAVALEETFISSTLVTVDEAFCAMHLRVLSVFCGDIICLPQMQKIQIVRQNLVITHNYPLIWKRQEWFNTAGPCGTSF